MKLICQTCGEERDHCGSSTAVLIKCAECFTKERAMHPLQQLKDTIEIAKEEAAYLPTNSTAGPTLHPRTRTTINRLVDSLELVLETILSMDQDVFRKDKPKSSQVDIKTRFSVHPWLKENKAESDPHYICKANGSTMYEGQVPPKMKRSAAEALATAMNIGYTYNALGEEPPKNLLQDAIEQNIKLVKEVADLKTELEELQKTRDPEIVENALPDLLVGQWPTHNGFDIHAYMNGPWHKDRTVVKYESRHHIYPGTIKGDIYRASCIITEFESPTKHPSPKSVPDRVLVTHLKDHYGNGDHVYPISIWHHSHYLYIKWSSKPPRHDIILDYCDAEVKSRKETLQFYVPPAHIETGHIYLPVPPTMIPSDTEEIMRRAYAGQFFFVCQTKGDGCASWSVIRDSRDNYWMFRTRHNVSHILPYPLFKEYTVLEFKLAEMMGGKWRYKDA